MIAFDPGLIDETIVDEKSPVPTKQHHNQDLMADGAVMVF